jgi:hypothetical protein
MMSLEGVDIMRDITSGEITRIKNSYDDSLQGVCQISNYSGSSVNSFGEVIETVTSASSVCGFYHHGGLKSYHGQLVQVDSDATLRLPKDTVVYIDSEVTIVSTYGVTSGSPRFSVYSSPKAGLGGIVIELKRIET